MGAAGWSMYGRQIQLAALLNPEIFVPMASLQLALTRTVPVANATPAQLVEPLGGGYLRAEYLADTSHWTATGFGEYYNTIGLSFPAVVTSWGLITGWALIHPEASQCLAMGSLMNPFVAEVGMVPTVAPGVLLLGNYD